MDAYTQMLLMMFARDWYGYTAITIPKRSHNEIREMMNERERICGEEFKRLQRDFYNLKE